MLIGLYLAILHSYHQRTPAGENNDGNNLHKLTHIFLSMHV